MPAEPRSSRRRAGSAALLVLAAAVVVGMFGVVPVQSQALRLEARSTTAAVPLDDPWALVWDSARLQRVPLSAQEVAAPFGGGEVPSLLARALHDGNRLYVLLEWSDGTPDDSVNDVAAFSDAAAIQFPAAAGEPPPYTMGGPGQPVNIWHWKAVWQADIDRGYATGATRYPDTYVDDYPNAGDPAYRPAEDVGNILAQRERLSPVENTFAAGFGSLTTADVQDVAGSGEWRDGRWRALFARDLAAAEPGMADFSVGADTMVAFAVWDGGAGNRNGQKSIAQFVELRLSATAAPEAVPPGGDGDGPLSPWASGGVLAGVLAGGLVLAAWATRAQRL